MSGPTDLQSIQPIAPRCRAHSKRTGQQCQKTSIRGGTVCRFHGGSAPQVQAKAERRLRAMVDPMIDRLEQLAHQTDNPKVAAECVRDALDRAGIGALVQAKVRSSHRSEASTAGVTVNIGFLVQPDPTPPAIDALPITDDPMLADDPQA